MELWSVWRISFISETVSKHWPQAGHEEHKPCSGHERGPLGLEVRARASRGPLLTHTKKLPISVESLAIAKLYVWTFSLLKLKTIITQNWICDILLWQVDSTCWGRLLEYVEKFTLCVCSVMSLQPHGRWPSRLLCPFNFPGKTLEQVAISYSMGSSQPRHCLAGRVFTTAPSGKAYILWWLTNLCVFP